MCGGPTLDDIEARRNDANYHDARGARAIPDPSTVGDFYRRLGPDDVLNLQTAINEARLEGRRRARMGGTVGRQFSAAA